MDLNTLHHPRAIYPEPRRTVLNEWVDEETLYVALHTSDEGNAPEGANEVTAYHYDRQTLDEADVTISGAGPTTSENDNEIVFTEAADVDWGNVLNGPLWDEPADMARILYAHPSRRQIEGVSPEYLTDPTDVHLPHRSVPPRRNVHL